MKKRLDRWRQTHEQLKANALFDSCLTEPEKPNVLHPEKNYAHRTDQAAVVESLQTIPGNTTASDHP